MLASGKTQVTAYVHIVVLLTTVSNNNCRLGKQKEVLLKYTICRCSGNGCCADLALQESFSHPCAETQS